MILRCVWPSCDHRQKREATPIGAFWAEATHKEALQSVFPTLSPVLELESEQLAAKASDWRKQFRNHVGPFASWSPET